MELPFYDIDVKRMYMQIKTGNKKVPKNKLSPWLEELISEMLNSDPNCRPTATAILMNENIMEYVKEFDTDDNTNIRESVINNTK